MTTRIVAAGVLMFGSGGTARAQLERVSIDAALHTSDKPYIQAAGEATVSAKPDQALIEIGVVTKGSTALAAATHNARQTDTVISGLRKLLLGRGSQLKTTTYSVRPNYRCPKPGAAAVVSGYIAGNTVEVTLDDLTQVSQVIDSATASGANTIQRLQYRLKNARIVRGEALKEAPAQAKASAEAIASGLGLRIVRVLSVEEAGADWDFGMAKKPPPPPPPGATPATPVEIGMIEIEARVNLRVEIGQ